MENIKSHSPTSSTPPRKKILQLTHKDGREEFLTVVSDETSLEQAFKILGRKYRDVGNICIVYNESFLSAYNIPEWEQIKAEVLSSISGPEQKVLNRLKNTGVDESIIDLVDRDMNYADNVSLFWAYADIHFQDRTLFESLRRTYNIAQRAHLGQTYKRPKDLEGLDTVPYFNHPLQMAYIGMTELKLDSKLLEALLMHDVIEDCEVRLLGTELTGKDFSYIFDPDVLAMVLDCSQRPDETREMFLARTKSLTGNSKIVKCVDRYHNLIRAYTLDDAKYLLKITKESIEIYVPAFVSIETLAPIKDQFFLLLAGLPEYTKRLNRQE